MTNTRLLFHLSVFSNQFGMMLTIIVRACYDLINFMFILYFFVFIFGMCTFIVNDDHKITFSLASAYQLIFGENLRNFAYANTSVQFLYILATNFLIIVCLNILISIVTENYDNV